MTRYPLLTLNVGKPQDFRNDGATSTIAARQPVHAPILLTQTGFAGDKVADPVHHGGADKAIHHYPYEHYTWWQETLGDHPLLQQPGAFGENIATKGLTEENVYIGDRFRLGEALVEVSHGRQPCWKLDHHFQRSGKDSVMKHIIRSGRCGLYFRVLESGMVAPDDTMDLIESGNSPWTVHRVFDLLIAGKHKDDIAAIKALSHLDLLAEAWRQRATKLIS